MQKNAPAPWARQHAPSTRHIRPLARQMRNVETSNTSPGTNNAKIDHFEQAKAMPVSVEAQPVPAKAMAVSSPRRHSRAQATAVSDKRAVWSTGPRCDTQGQRRGPDRRQNNAPNQTTATRPHWCGGRRRDRRDRRAWLRRLRAAAGPGRASSRRAERSSRRGRRAGGPPPMGASSSPASAADQPQLSQRSTSRRRARPRR